MSEEVSAMMNTGDADNNNASFVQHYEEVVLNYNWWWAVQIFLSALALIANFVFLMTVVYNRKRREIKTFVTAVIVSIAVLDMVDVLRILPILWEDLFYTSIFRHVYCSFGIFHELSVSVFLVALSIFINVQAGRENKYYTNDLRASLPQKIFIPIVLALAIGASAPFFLLPYDSIGHTCTDPFKIEYVMDTESKSFSFNLYSTVVTVFIFILPVVIIPIALPIAFVKTCIAKQCCIPRFKQPIGEMIMTSVISLFYLATIVGIILPRLDQAFNWGKVELGPAPLLWELANNAARPLCYFMMNPGVWEGLRSLCCRKKIQPTGDEEGIEVPLSPVTTV